MEQPGMRVIRPANEGGSSNSNDLIIWLDKHIGKSSECVLLKRAFFMTTDPTNADAVSLHEEDINNSIQLGGPVPIQLDGVQFTLRAFDDPSACYDIIRNNLNKRIFFITSGSKGQYIVSRLVENFPGTFVAERPIYIFCAKMNMITTEGAGDPTNDWAWDYENNVIMYNHQDDLLARLVLDIATYFLTEGERLLKDGQLDDALKRFEWTRLMFIRYEKIVEKPNLMKDNIKKTVQYINDIEQRLKEQSDSESDHMSKPCA